MIEDPNYRWYRRGKEYAGLFRFQDSENQKNVHVVLQLIQHT